MTEMGERMAAAEADIRNLKEQQRDHEIECVRYREQTARKLDTIQDAQAELVQGQASMSQTLDTWRSVVSVAWTIGTTSAAAVAGWLANAFMKWMGWV